MKAELIYKISLKKIEKMIGHNKTTYADELSRVGFILFGYRFHGVFPSDKIPELTKNKPYMIVNLDSSNQSGSHWTAVARLKTGSIMFYDSFGRGYTKILPSLKNRKLPIINTEDDAEQNILESNCGARSLSFFKVFDDYGAKIAKEI